MIVTVFRARTKAGLPADVLKRLEAAGERMAELAPLQAGFISYKDFASPDGEAVTVVEFDTREHVAAWREHPEHKAVQTWARWSMGMIAVERSGMAKQNQANRPSARGSKNKSKNCAPNVLES